MGLSRRKKRFFFLCDSFNKRTAHAKKSLQYVLRFFLMKLLFRAW